MYFDKVFEFRGLNLGDFRKIPFLELRCKFKQTVIDSEVFVVALEAVMNLIVAT